MRFLKVTWNHTHPNEPYLIYQEVGDDSFETRKVEVLASGVLLGYASETTEVGDSILTDQPIPDIEEINTSNEFNAEFVTQQEFEQIWTWATTMQNS